MKNLRKRFLTVVIGLATLFLTSNVIAQTAPIQSGSSNYNGDLYHNGDIGLGSSSPSARLHILRPSNSSPFGNIWSDDYFKIQSKIIQGGVPPSFITETQFIVNSVGNVGIGTASPTEKLHIMGDVRGGESAGALKLQTDYGHFRFGPMDNSFCHFKTDLPGFHFDKYVRIDADLVIWNPNGLGNGSKQIVLKSNGEIRAREVKVDLALIPDYVFAEDYNLMPLADVKTFIKENKHLPNVKSEAEFQEEGSISLTEMNLKLLEKIEELTLYILQLEERITNLEN